MSKYRLVFMGIVVLAGVLAGYCRGPTDEPIKDTYWDISPAWSTAGDRITFSGPGDRDSIFTYVLYMVDTNGANLTPLSIGGLASTWLPGDTAIIFMKTNFKLYYLSQVGHVDLRRDKMNVKLE